MKKLYFGTNLKMYKTIDDTKEYLLELQELTRDIAKNNQFFVIPSYTALSEARKITDDMCIKLGAQNMCWEDEGQFTGEISPVMLEEIGIKLVMVGHSERRHVFGECNQEENLKVKKAVEKGFTALLCIGETQEEKNFGISAEILRTQLKVGLFGLNSECIEKLWIAYEPVWSIGVNGVPATAEYAQKMHKVIKDCLLDIFGAKANEIPVLYGGSVNPDNASELIIQESIDGLFVGRSAWKAKAFDTLIRDAISTYESNIKK